MNATFKLVQLFGIKFKYNYIFSLSGSSQSKGPQGGRFTGGPPRSRTVPSGGAQLAGAAALARAENSQSKEVDW